MGIGKNFEIFKKKFLLVEELICKRVFGSLGFEVYKVIFLCFFENFKYYNLSRIGVFRMFLFSNNGLGGELLGICGLDYIRDIFLILFYSSLRKLFFFIVIIYVLWKGYIVF